MENKCITLEVTICISSIIRKKHKLIKCNSWGSALCTSANQPSQEVEASVWYLQCRAPKNFNNFMTEEDNQLEAEVS